MTSVSLNSPSLIGASTHLSDVKPVSAPVDAFVTMPSASQVPQKASFDLEALAPARRKGIAAVGSPATIVVGGLIGLAVGTAIGCGVGIPVGEHLDHHHHPGHRFLVPFVVLFPIVFAAIGAAIGACIDRGGGSGAGKAAC